MWPAWVCSHSRRPRLSPSAMPPSSPRPAPGAAGSGPFTPGSLSILPTVMWRAAVAFWLGRSTADPATAACSRRPHAPGRVVRGRGARSLFPTLPGVADEEEDPLKRLRTVLSGLALLVAACEGGGHRQPQTPPSSVPLH